MFFAQDLFNRAKSLFAREGEKRTCKGWWRKMVDLAVRAKEVRLLVTLFLKRAGYT